MARRHYSLSDGEILATAYTEDYVNGWGETVTRVVSSVTSSEGYLGSTGIMRQDRDHIRTRFTIARDGGSTYGGYHGYGDTPANSVQDYLLREVQTFKRTIKSESPVYRVIRFRSIPGRRGQVYR